MAKEIYQKILEERSSGTVFSKIRRDLLESKRFEEAEITHAIGKVHDNETEIKKAEQVKKKNFSLFIGSSIILLISLGYTLYTFIDESLSFFALLYGPIIGGLTGAALGLDKYRGAVNRISLLKNKFK
ncbi:MAG: hypothetical protein RLN81_06475 [Balneolaceae bacterium]